MSGSAIEREAQLKALRVQLAEKNGEMKSAKLEAAAAQRKVSGLEADVRTLTARIGALETTAQAAGVGVSDHAVVRWLERIHGLNIDSVKSEILDGGTETMARFMGNGKIEKRNHVLVVKNNTIITVAPKNPGSITL